ncbi:MAG TPA: hypothetical protein VHF89_12010 [Solirubrobacteraceae bacterium]|nr:hypothetical protein [Solirubrobacteraceae bacterium]
MEPVRLVPDDVQARLPPEAAEERIRELEHRLELERARREAIEAGIDTLSARCHELARENAALREQLGGSPDAVRAPDGAARVELLD